MFLARLQAWTPLAGNTRALDLGCGDGVGLLPLARRFHHVVGLEPDLSQLILARKLCEEHAISNVQLVQGYGQQLPFPDEHFNYVTAQNVLEHVFEADQVVAEVARVLEGGGGFAADSRNRYDLFFPEPHVQLHGVGLLPRRLTNAYVRWRIGTSYDLFHTRLLSYGDVRRALWRSFGPHFRIVLPRVVAYGISERWDRRLAAIERIPLLSGPLIVFFPTHLALARKPSSPQRPGT